MGDIGLNENITAGSREFHIQTSTLVDEGVIRTEIFEKGRLLFVENSHYERRNHNQDRGAEQRLRKIVDKFHQSIIEEIDGLFEMSERVFEENIPNAHEKIGQVFLFTHIFDKAEKHFQRALELDEKRFSCYVYLGRCYYLQKRYNQALEILSKIMDQQVRYPDTYNLLGLIMMEKRNYRQALHHFREALKYNPAYIEAYFNLSEAILQRIIFLKLEEKEADLKKSLDFLRIIFKKIDNYGNVEDREQSLLINKALHKMDLRKALALMHKYREKKFIRYIPPEIIGFKFYLRLLYGEDEMPYEILRDYEEKLVVALQENPSYPDLWQYLALIHLMQCRHYFLKGLDDFRDATKINPHFDKAAKNLRLVENDGREFLSLIKAIV
jgi:tetratricopeptide (TPR) repeat protein